MDAYIIIEEVPYGLNVDFELIALSPIAVELCEHLRLAKETPAKVCMALAFISLYFRNYLLQAEAWRVY
jgi:hypothetical protein